MPEIGLPPEGGFAEAPGAATLEFAENRLLPYGSYAWEFIDYVDAQARIALLESYRAFFRAHTDRYISLYELVYDNPPRWAQGWGPFFFYCGFDELHDIYESRDFDVWEEQCEMEIELYRKIESYWELVESMWEAEDNADVHKARLDRLRDVQRKYSQGYTLRW